MKSKLLAGFLFLFCLIAGSEAAAQIIDDTTKVLYSPKTTLRVYENDVLEGRYLEQRIDTTIQNMHNERYWYQDTAYFQHLGNMGTASKPLLFRMPDKIGARSGKTAFSRYAYNPEKINYYDTRSPYSHIYYIQGQRGEQVFEGTHARNITPRWNAGVAYQIITGNRQIGVSNLNRDGYMSHQSVKAFTHYQSENDKYDLFANYTHLNHEQIEFGGIRPGDGDAQEDLFRYQAEITNLNQAATREFRNKYHLLHIYKLAGENMKVYHSLDWGRQRDIYQDDAIPYTTDSLRSLIFYPKTLYSPIRTDDRTNYRELQNVFGITGNSKISFYKAYVKQRSSKMEYSVLKQQSAVDTARTTITESERLNQLFVGGQFRLNYGQALVSVDGEFQMTRDYKVSATAKLGPLQGRVARVLRSPSMLEQRLISNHFNWLNNFNNSVTDRLEGSYTGKLGDKQFVRLTGHYDNIKRLVFFNENAVPEQLDKNQQLYGGELQHHIRFGPIHLENFVAYTNTDKAETIRIPEWVVDSKLYFEGSLFKKALFGQFGVQMYLPTDYKADAYMPVTQQFYLQNEFTIRTYPVVDVFLTADIKTLNVFLKLSHINEGLTAPGYFVTPFYPGMRTSFIFGIKWMFFD